MKLLLKGAKVIDYNKEFKGDIYIEDGKILDFGPDLNYDCEIINCNGLVVMPSFIDLHTHFRDPGFTYKEDLYTGSKAALKGGYTFVNLMANTNPICSSMEVVNYVLEKSKELDLIDIHQTVSITKDFDGKTLEHIDSLGKEVKFLSDDGKGVQESVVMYRALKKAKEKNLTIIAHEEDEGIVGVDSRLSENIMTFRDIELVRGTRAKLHLAHVSTKQAIEGIVKGKEEGLPITCEVTPHHISLYNNSYKVNPPIRKKEDVSALIEAIKAGYVDAIGTDHAPHSVEDKKNGACGISGLETAFSISYTTLVRGGHTSLNKLSEIMSANPGEIADINKGRIEVGYDGDLVLLDLNKEVKINSKNFVSKGKNTPFNGEKYWGEIIATIKSGKVKYNGGIEVDYR
ncbi:MAG TPA: dihydroorotase [Tissierellia bacterium]|nr:dihydroorotase [Tissierellia bacterium]